MPKIKSPIKVSYSFFGGQIRHQIFSNRSDAARFEKLVKSRGGEAKLAEAV